MTEEQKQRRRETHRAWVAKNRDRVREISKRAKQKAMLRDPEGWRRKNRERGLAYHAKHGHKKRQYNHKANLKRHYKMTVEDYNSILSAQGGKCAICRCAPEVSLFKRLYVDHDHQTMVIRGLLCQRCNAALGQFGDNLAGIQRVIDYLVKAEIHGRKIA